jgi:uncharacterized membrane protein (DUF4010 family)
MNPGIDTPGLWIAALSGAAVGIERQRSGHAAGPQARFAGVRTFTMIGALGGLAGGLWSAGLSGPAAALLAGTAAMTVAGYLAASWREVDATTEVAALVVLAAGLIAGLGGYRLASGIVALTCLLLAEKSRLHALVARIDDVGLRAGMRFGVMALVVLPLLPEGPYGPWGGVRPREIWALVLFFSGLNFLGYVARRALGSSRGSVVAGALGGLVSSTNVTLTFARASRARVHSDLDLAFGALAANAMLYPRVLVAVAVLNLPLLPSVARYLALPGLVAIAAVVVGMRWSQQDHAEGPVAANPLQLAAALKMALLFQSMLILVHLMERTLGTTGLFGTAAVLGLTDVDALTASMARGLAHSAGLDIAAAAIGVGVLANTALKLAVSLALGSPTYRAVTGGVLLLMLLATAVTLILGWSATTWAEVLRYLG